MPLFAAPFRRLGLLQHIAGSSTLYLFHPFAIFSALSLFTPPFRYLLHAPFRHLLYPFAIYYNHALFILPVRYLLCPLAIYSAISPYNKVSLLLFSRWLVTSE